MLGNSSSPSSGSHPGLCESITQSSGPSGQLSTLPALGRVSPSSRSEQEEGIPRLGVLGSTYSRVRGPRRFVVDCRSGSCGPWWEQDGPGLHRRSKRRLSLQSSLQDGSRKSAHVTRLRGWIETEWRVRDGRGQVCSARQQTICGRDVQLLSV